MVSALFLRYDYKRENRRRGALRTDIATATGSGSSGLPSDRDREKAHIPEGHTDVPIIDSLEEYQDLTDKQRKDFRYVF